MSQTEPDEARLRLEQDFGHEPAVLAEHLVAIVDTIADVDQAVVGNAHAMHRRAELLRDRRLRIVGAGIGVVRRGPVRTPVPLVLPARGIEDDHAPVLVAVGDVQLAGGGVHHGQRGPAEQVRWSCCHRSRRARPICIRNFPSRVNFST